MEKNTTPKTNNTNKPGSTPDDSLYDLSYNTNLNHSHQFFLPWWKWGHILHFQNIKIYDIRIDYSSVHFLYLTTLFSWSILVLLLCLEAYIVPYSLLICTGPQVLLYTFKLHKICCHTYIKQQKQPPIFFSAYNSMKQRIISCFLIIHI